MAGLGGSNGARAPRIGVALIQQETNTWSPVSCTLDDFTSQDLCVGDAIIERYAGTNTEIGGAIRALREAGSAPVPLVRAWAASSGRLTRDALDHLVELLEARLEAVHLDGLLLCLHGAMAAEGVDDAETLLVRRARRAVGDGVPIVVTLDLHANVTPGLVEAADAVVGYHTYPHVDLAETGARGARLLLDRLAGGTVVTAVAKRPMIVPAESMSAGGPLGKLRRRADTLTVDGILDISLFPVQPWLDVEDLGFAVTVTTDGDERFARIVAERLADEAWDLRGEFTVSLFTPEAAIAAARASSVRPFIISESADAPTAGAWGDSPVMVRALLEHGRGLVAYVTIADAPAVARCVEAGVGTAVNLEVGCSVDARFHTPAALSGVVERIGDDPVILRGPSYTGIAYSMGTFAVVRAGTLHVLISQRPPFTLDPETFVHAGLDPARADVIVVRSALGFRAAYPPLSVQHAVVLDVAGASTPRLDLLDFVRAPRPLYPIDPVLDPEAAGAGAS